MMVFESCAAFADHLSALARRMPDVEAALLRRGAVMLQRKTGANLDACAGGLSPYAAWPGLRGAPADGFAPAGGQWRAGSLGLGYPPPDHSRRNTAHDGIGITVRGHEAAIGGNSDWLVWQETGAPEAEHGVAPCHQLATAGFLVSADVAELIGRGVAAALAGQPSGDAE